MIEIAILTHGFPLFGLSFVVVVSLKDDLHANHRFSNDRFFAEGTVPIKALAAKRFWFCVWGPGGLCLLNPSQS